MATIIDLRSLNLSDPDDLPLRGRPMRQQMRSAYSAKSEPTSTRRERKAARKALRAWQWEQSEQARDEAQVGHGLPAWDEEETDDAAEWRLYANLGGNDADRGWHPGPDAA